MLSLLAEVVKVSLKPLEELSALSGASGQSVAPPERAFKRHLNTRMDLRDIVGLVDHDLIWWDVLMKL